MAMRFIVALHGLETHPALCDLTLEIISRYARLIGHLKCDTLQPQPLDQSDFNTAPKFLPPSIIWFLHKALEISLEFIQDSWDILKDYLWECEKVPLNKDDYEAFKKYGWEKGMITDMTMFPPSNRCINTACTNTKPLKKENPRRVLVYPLPNGVQPAWAVHIYCPNVPNFIEVGDHQFVEQVVVRMWINNLLLGWVSASNSAKGYNMVLSGKDYLNDGEWEFVPRLRTEQVWDAIILVSLLDDKKRYQQQLRVPHTGLQKDRFTNAMEERNKDIIHNGQPDVVCHACDKCFRTYKTADDEIHTVQPIVGDGLSMGRPCCGVFRCTEPLQSNRHRFCQMHFNNHQQCAIVGCDAPVAGEGSKACSNAQHRQMEVQNKERSASTFILKERFQDSDITSC